MAVYTIVRDLGWNDIQRRVMAANGRMVRVGVQNAPSEVLDYAAYNEFGTRTAPARPFMKHTADKYRLAIYQIMERVGRQVAAGQMTSAAGLGQVGVYLAAKIRDEIRNSAAWAAPNAPSTLAGKTGTTPLIDSKELIEHISWTLR